MCIRDSTWFKRINKYGKKLGLEVEHYIISSGMKEIIENVTVADAFKHIYACSYFYDESGFARWPAQIVNYTTKTQYILSLIHILDKRKHMESMCS